MKLPDLEIFHFPIFFSDHGNPDKTQAVNSNFVSENPSNLYCIIIDRKVYCEKGDISASTMLLTLCILRNFYIWFNTMTLIWFIVHVKGSQVRIQILA